METPEKKSQKRVSTLTGAALFLALVVYFNIRSPAPATTVDLVVMGVGRCFLFLHW